MSLHERIAKELKWRVEETRQFSLQQLRDLVRSTNAQLAHDIDEEIRSGSYIKGTPMKRRRNAGECGDIKPGQFVRLTVPAMRSMGLHVERDGVVVAVREGHPYGFAFVHWNDGSGSHISCYAIEHVPSHRVKGYPIDAQGHGYVGEGMVNALQKKFKKKLVDAGYAIPKSGRGRKSNPREDDAAINEIAKTLRPHFNDRRRLFIISRSWHDYGFTPTQVRSYVAQGVTQPATAADMRLRSEIGGRRANPERSAASAAACATGMRAHTKSRRKIEKVCGKNAPHTHTASTRFSQMGVDARVRKLMK